MPKNQSGIFVVQNPRKINLWKKTIGKHDWCRNIRSCGLGTHRLLRLDGDENTTAASWGRQLPDYLSLDPYLAILFLALHGSIFGTLRYTRWLAGGVWICLACCRGDEDPTHGRAVTEKQQARLENLVSQSPSSPACLASYLDINKPCRAACLPVPAETRSELLAFFASIPVLLLETRSELS